MAEDGAEERRAQVIDREVQKASDLLGRVETEIRRRLAAGPSDFDLKINLYEMLNLMKSLAKCQTQADVQSHLGLSRKKSLLFGSVAIFFAVLDAWAFDLYGIYQFWKAERPWLLATAVLILLIAIGLGMQRAAS